MGDLGRSVGDAISNAMSNIGDAVAAAIGNAVDGLGGIPGGPLWLLALAVLVGGAWLLARR